MPEPFNKPIPKVLFLSAWYPIETDSMIGLFVKKHALAASDVASVFVIHASPDTSGSGKYRLVKETRENFHELIVYYPVPNRKFLPGKFHLLGWLKANYKGYRIMKKEWGLPDLTHVNILTRVGLLAMILKMIHRVPYIITEHWSRYLNFYPKGVPWYHPLLTRLIIKKASKLTVVSEKLGEAMIKQKLVKEFTLIGNVVETELFFPRSKINSNRKKTIIHVSCFEEKSKNLTGTLNSIKELTRLRNDFVVKMVGDGPDFEMATAYAKQLSLSPETIVFEGLQEKQNLAEIMAGGDLLILFSHYETFGIVVYESMSCGVPVLVSDTADFSNNIAPEFGRIISGSKQPEELAREMDNMLNSHAQFDENAMRRFVVDHFGEKAIAAKFSEFYRITLQKK